jgi:hypothetical protein
MQEIGAPNLRAPSASKLRTDSSACGSITAVVEGFKITERCQGSTYLPRPKIRHSILCAIVRKRSRWGNRCVVFQLIFEEGSFKRSVCVQTSQPVRHKYYPKERVCINETLTMQCKSHVCTSARLQDCTSLPFAADAASRGGEVISRIIDRSDGLRGLTPACYLLAIFNAWPL